MRRFRPRVVPILATLLVAGLALRWFRPGRDAGTWMCRVCCAAQEEVRLFGLRVQVGPPKEAWWQDHGREYERWFREAVRLEHDHDWEPVGCHMQGRRIACAVVPPYDGVVYETVLALQERPLARDIAVTFARVEGPQRRWELAGALGEVLRAREYRHLEEVDPGELLAAVGSVMHREPWASAMSGAR